MKTLHLTRTFPALMPRYVERFRCTGAQCEDTCCSGWNVVLDKKTFATYRQLSRPELSGVIGSSIERLESKHGDQGYGRIRLDPETRACPLTHEGLCSVQKHMNESYLSHTCFTYPRYTRRFGGQVEQALSLSCPEAARLALLAPDAFDFVDSPVTVRMEAVANAAAGPGVQDELMNEIRILCLKLVRTEGLELWQKLAVLGLFCESLTEMLQAGQHALVPALIENTVTMIEQGHMLAALADLQPNHGAQALVFSAFWNGPDFEANAGAIASPIQKETVAAIRRGIGAPAGTGEASPEQLVAAYAAGVKRLPEALAAAPHLLEHFLLNEMFRELFPFSGANPYQAFLQLIAQYGLLRLMLAARCNTEGALPDASAMVQTVHVFYRLFQHDPRFGQMHAALAKGGFGSLDKVYGFLRT